VPVVVVNGRVGDRSFARMRRLRRFLGPVLGPVFDPIGRFGVQTEGDADRLVELGVPEERITVTGNLKYDSPEPPPLPDLEERLLAVAAGRPLLVAGSTMAGEEAQVLEAFRAAGGGSRALLILAPRHPERWGEAVERAVAAGFRLVLRSGFGGGGDGGGSAAEGSDRGGSDRSRAGEGGPAAEVVLLDSLGELAAVYRLAAAAFIGGTLVPTGGHNPLEAALWGVPLAVGPSMTSFREMAADFDSRGAWARVEDARALGRTWSRWLDDPDEARRIGGRARLLVAENRGALARTIEMLRPIVEGIET
jgi:3-deoxy-D-manno-octulosonic-acid transferase